MSERRNVAWGQSAPVVATAAALWITGVVALPFIFGGQPTGLGPGLVWLGAAVAITAVLLALVPNLSRLLAAGLARLSSALASRDAPSSATFNSGELLIVARLLVLAAALLIIQAVLRRPIALVLGGDRQGASVEAGIAAGALMLILPLLVWTYHTTRPMVQATTLRILDAAIPTIGTAALAEPATRGSHIVRPPTAGQATEGDSTIAATRRADSARTVITPRDGDKTQVSRPVDDRTEVSAPDDNRTAVSPRDNDKTAVSPGDDDKTTVSPRDDDQTAVSPRDDDKTAVSPHDSDRTVASPRRSDDPRPRGA